MKRQSAGRRLTTVPLVYPPSPQKTILRPGQRLASASMPSTARAPRLVRRFSSRHASSSSGDAPGAGRRAVGAWPNRTGSMRASPSPSGHAALNIRKRWPAMRLVWKAGPRGSRRHATPGMRLPVFRTVVSSTPKTSGPCAGVAARTSARAPSSRASASARPRL